MNDANYHYRYFKTTRTIAQKARALAQTAGIELTRLEWSRGRETAELDSYQLMLEAGNHPAAARIPDAWLEELRTTGRSDQIDTAVAQTVAALKRALTPAEEASG
ncbi:MAG: hypothetical protein ACRET1_06105 [Burkholderiales bacterium]